MKHFWLYMVVLISLAFMLLFSLGGGIWGAQSTLTHWTGEMFRGVCHQNPERSFWFKGAYMAVNTRCFGIFFGLFLGWILMPLLSWKKMNNYWAVWVLVLAIAAQIIDYSGNLLQWWENTNMSRFYLGLVLGAAIPLTLVDQFYIKQNERKNE